MEIERREASLKELNKFKRIINTQSDYQRPEVWKTAQKQLLIDSILRRYDIPKIYFKKEDAGDKYVYEVIDGQQRLVAIWGYFNGDFALSKDAEPIAGHDCASQLYGDLSPNLRRKFDHYKINVITITDAILTKEKDEVGELFLRLQNGTPLNAQEKRNAMPGNMKDFVKELAEHDFFKNCAFKNKRYTFDQKAAQLICLELSLESSNRPCKINSSELDKMYKEHKEFDNNGKVVKHVKKTLDYLNKAFPNRTLQLAHHNVITLYCLASNLIKSYNYGGTEQKFFDWFIDFEVKRKNNDKLENDKKDASLLTYTNAITKAADGQVSIKIRLKFVQESFFLAAPDILPKDET